MVRVIRLVRLRCVISFIPASVYTEMNAMSKGVALGIFEESKGKGLEAIQGGGQPYVDLMGRK